MEIKVNIPQNDYIQPTDVREDVVQKICDVFLDRRGGSIHNVFHPVSDGCYRVRTLGLRVHKSDGKAYDFNSSPLSCDEFIKFHGSEMKAAFEALIKAGYHMFKIYEYGSWMGYVCDKKPQYHTYNGTWGTEVTSFTDFID